MNDILMRDFIVDFMDKLDFPEDARETFLYADDRLARQSELVPGMVSTISDFMVKHLKFDSVLKRLDHLAQEMDCHVYTMHFLFLMYCAKPLRENYKKAGIPEAVYWNTMLDLPCKLRECRGVYGIWGTFVAFWYPGFYTMERFGLGRMQYEQVCFSHDDYTKGGYTLHKGDKVYNMHIPSLGPLTREERVDSYKRAYAFYKDELNGKPMAVVCHSWLLYPENKLFFPEHSNILDFMSDFEIIHSTEQETFSDAWRVFGRDFEKPVDQLPVGTSLQRAYVKWLGDGHKTGNGYGVMLFDGDKIL